MPSVASADPDFDTPPGLVQDDGVVTEEETPPPAEEETVPPAEEETVPPAEEETVPPAEEETVPPAEEQEADGPNSAALLDAALAERFSGAAPENPDLTVAAPKEEEKEEKEEKGGPRGNNGTIKIDGADFSDGPNNEPHPGCVFDVKFFGFDEGELFASLTFEGIPPTGGGLLAARETFIGEDPNGGSGDLDATVTVNLTEALAEIEPHQQGWHVKLTVNADGSQGANKKHKVFWVSGCEAPEEPTPEEPTPEEPTPEEPELEGQGLTPQAASLARTGGDSMSLARFGIVLIAAGGVLARLSSRRRPRTSMS